MRKIMLGLLFGSCAAFGWAACSSDSSSGDAGDATTESGPDLCDQNAFLSSGGNGHMCPHASSRICFPIENCDAGGGGGCTCTATDAGPIWECYTPPECMDPCGNTSPIRDGGPDPCPDAGDEAGDDGGDQDAASDATPSDAADDGG